MTSDFETCGGGIASFAPAEPGGQDAVPEGPAAPGLATITFLGEGAGFANTLGVYTLDPESGAIGNVRIAFARACEQNLGGSLIPGDSAFAYVTAPGARIGLFMISNGASLNDFDALGEGTLAFREPGGAPATWFNRSPVLVHVSAADGAETVVQGAILHSAGYGAHAALNPDGQGHTSGLGEHAGGAVTVGFEDFSPGGEGACDDLVVRVALEGPGMSFDNAHFELNTPGGRRIHGAASEDFVIFEPDAGPEGGGSKDVDLAGLRPLAGRMPTPGACESQGQGSLAEADDGHSEPLLATPCFTPGTTIATLRGERRVEDLRVGDKVVTRDNGIQEIRWVGSTPMPPGMLVRNAHLQPVLIRAGALGHGLPERDMLVSPDHRVLVFPDRSMIHFDGHEVLASAKHLVNNRSILRTCPDGLRYIHFMCDRHEVVLANGAWTESFQPDDRTLGGLVHSQRAEILELFPALRTQAGQGAYGPARPVLARDEARELNES